MKAKGRRVGLIFLALVCLLLGIPAVLTWRAIRQERLNRALIHAAKQGADPNCHETPSTPTSP